MTRNWLLLVTFLAANTYALYTGPQSCNQAADCPFDYTCLTHQCSRASHIDWENENVEQTTQSEKMEMGMGIASIPLIIIACLSGLIVLVGLTYFIYVLKERKRTSLEVLDYSRRQLKVLPKKVNKKDVPYFVMAPPAVRCA